MAAMRTAVTPTESQGLVSDLSSGLKATLEARVNPIADLKPEAGVDPRAMILDELKEANRIVSEKATPEEVSAYRAWLMNSARNAAEAAKEGGFFGIGAVQVSEGEAALLAQLDQMLGQD
jgi:hypothetical protein